MILGTSSHKFTRDGQLVQLAGCDFFVGFARFLRFPDDIRPQLSQLRDLFTETNQAPFLRVLRTFFSFNGALGVLRPGDHADFYQRIPGYLDLLGEYGFQCLGVACADWQNMPSTPTPLEHYQRVGAALAQRPHLHLLSGGNELDHATNRLEDVRFPSIPGVLCSRGSMTGARYPIVPALDFAEFHPRRDGLKGQIRVVNIGFVVKGDEEADPPFPGTHVPSIVDEWKGCPRDVHVHTDARTAYPDDHYRAAILAGTYGAGFVYHCDSGMQAQLLTDREVECGKTALMGLTKVDPVQQFTGRI